MASLLALCLCLSTVVQLSASQQLTDTVSCSSAGQAELILSAVNQLTDSINGTDQMLSQLQETVSLLQTSMAQLHSDVADIRTRVARIGELKNQDHESRL